MAQGSKRRKLSNGAYEASSPVPDLAVKPDNADATPSKDQRTSLFVRSLPASVTTERLTEYFSQSFPLKHATVVLDPSTKLSRGFGFVTFTDAEDAQAAAQEFNDSVLDGRKIKVEIAESRNREVAEEVGGKSHSVNTKASELRDQRQKQKEENQPPKLIVRNLPWSIKTPEDLSNLFRSYGKVKHAVVPTLGTKAREQAGFGFVIIRGKKNAERALEGVNGKEVDGRTLAVDWAVDKETWQKLQQDQTSGAKETTAGLDEGDVEPEASDEAEGAPVSSPEEADDVSTSSAEAVEAEDEDDDDEEDDELPADLEAEDIESGDDEDLDTSAIKEKSALISNNTTVFLRNLPFTADDDSCFLHFKTNFGPVRYVRVVYDHETERSRGTAFICFYNEQDAKDCVKNAPKQQMPAFVPGNDRKRRGETLTHSLLQNESLDPSGKYTMDGRILQVTRALDKSEADRRTAEGIREREKRLNDKRRLYLLSEGTIAKGSKLYNALGKAELDIRESSARQRQKLIKTNPNLGLSLTRLSVRNMPRFLDGKELKALAREAVVGFATDVKEGKRQPLSKEEINRGGEAEREAEDRRREQGKGLVKQSKIVYESELTGSKVGEGKGGRSRGYGFIEYYSHRHALMGLRWMNGHTVKGTGGDGLEKGKSLIVEFAIENAQVVQRRAEREKRITEGGTGGRRGPEERKRKRDEGRQSSFGKGDRRNRNASKDEKPKKPDPTTPVANPEEKNKLAMRNRIIAQKRQKRKTRRGKA